jgi:hypothetical protein
MDVAAKISAMWGDLLKTEEAAGIIAGATGATDDVLQKLLVSGLGTMRERMKVMQG